MFYDIIFVNTAKREIENIHIEINLYGYMYRNFKNSSCGGG